VPDLIFDSPSFLIIDLWIVGRTAVVLIFDVAVASREETSFDIVVTDKGTRYCWWKCLRVDGLSYDCAALLSHKL
jgi:hypothetical protein